MHIEKWEFNFDLSNKWLKEANYDPSKLQQNDHYKYETPPGKEVFIINIPDICPRIRNKNTPIFNDGEVEIDGQRVFKTARERTVFILKALVEKKSLSPIDVVKYEGPGPYKYKLTDGTHRLHCSIALGFEKIPAVWGFDITNC
jgi:hypothetical protein